VVFPLVAIATFEAVYGLNQSWSGAVDGPVRGSYANRNHFAGLLELVLPFAAAYPLPLLQRRERGADIPLPAVLKTCLSWTVAATLLFAIMYSLSRMGFISAMVSFLVIGTLGVWTSRVARLFATRTRKLAATGAVVLMVLLLFVFLPPNELIERFAQASTDQDSPDGGWAVERDSHAGSRISGLWLRAGCI